MQLNVFLTLTAVYEFITLHCVQNATEHSANVSTRLTFRNHIGELGEECIGRLDDLSTIVNIPFRASTILVGVAVIIALLAICAMLMFFFCQSTTVFYMCAWMQVVSGNYPGFASRKIINLSLVLFLSH
jgi:hypothetical protein